MLADRTPRAGQPRVRDVFVSLWQHADRYVRGRVAWALGLVIVMAALTALGPVVLKDAIDRLAPSPEEHAGAMPLSALLALYVASIWLSRILGELRAIVYARAERRLHRSVSERLFEHLMHLPPRYHLERRTGAINQTLSSGLQGMQLLLQDATFTYLPVAVELCIMALVLLRLDQAPFLALFGIALLAYGFVFARAVRRMGAAARAASAAHIASGGVLTDGLLNFEAVKYFTAESLVMRRVTNALTRTEEEWVRFHSSVASNGISVGSIFALFVGATSFYAAHLVSVGRMTVGEFVLINTYVLQAVRPVEMLGHALRRVSHGIALLQALFEILHEPSEQESGERAERPGQRVVRPRNPAFVGAVSASLAFEHVHLSYLNGRAVLHDVSFVVPPGRTLAVVGASGAGKSSLVRLLVRFVEPDSGSICLDGVAIKEIPLKALRSAIAVVPQDTMLFDESIGYNIALGEPHASIDDIERAARIAHLHDFVMTLPARYDTRVGERGLKLSGGERQRISIARAAIRHPSVYVFDEATSSLDSRTEGEILANFREISRNCTTLIIAHRLSTIVHADEIVMLEGGMIVERGAHEALLGLNGRYAALWLAQQSQEVARASVNRRA